MERQDDPGRWIVESSQTPAPLARLEADATSLVNAELVQMPGLIQTADYARAVMMAGDMLPELAEERVNARLERQLILDKYNAPKLDILLEETALRRVVGSHAVMARQLRAVL